MKMPFGKHRGCDITDGPDAYLQWLACSIELRDPLRAAVLDEMDYRGLKVEAAPEPARPRFQMIQVECGHVGVLREIVDRGYRVVARACHPDQGGSTDAMIRLNAVAESVREQLARLQGERR